MKKMIKKVTSWKEADRLEEYLKARGWVCACKICMSQVDIEMHFIRREQPQGHETSLSLS